MRINIQNKAIGDGCPCFVIAEAGANANSSLEIAFKLVDQAAAAGADAIKFQHYSARQLVTHDAPKYYVDTMEEWKNGANPKGTQFDEFSQLDKLGFKDWKKIKKRCDEQGIIFLSTPFDHNQVELLYKLDVPAYKIASADITYEQLLLHVAQKKHPIILSTGAATLEEVKRAVQLIESAGNRQIILLHCTLHYPCRSDEVNLLAMDCLRSQFPYPVGLSDHSLGLLVSAAAIARGASVIEKHYTIDKNLAGSTDHFMSVDPGELNELVTMSREILKILGSPEKKPIAAEQTAILYARRSLVSFKDIKRGEPITEKNTIFKRPGTGISPADAKKIFGIYRAVCRIPADTVITDRMIE